MRPHCPSGSCHRFRGSRWLLLAGLLVIAGWELARAETVIRNGFQITDPLIPVAEILSGGPPRDGIPPLDKPQFVTVAETELVGPEHAILGLEIAGEAKAYPIFILNWHEIVNDTVGGVPVTVSYCPLCGSGTAFRRDFQGKPGTFGVSGLLYNSDLLMYDRETESLWSQMLGQAVSGPRKGERLEALPVTYTTWAEWRAQHSESLVLSSETGFRRDYTRSPYGNYDENGTIIFQISFRSKAFHPKERVLGVEVAGSFKAYPFAELAKVNSPLHDQIGETEIVLNFDADSRSGNVHLRNAQPLPAINAFWFAWYAFHPDTAVFRTE